MTRFDAFSSVSAETAFVRPGTPMFDALIRDLAQAGDLPPSRRRDLQSGLRRVAGALDRDPAQVPADPVWLQPRLARIAPAALGLTAKSWSNVLSNARAALAHAGLAHRRCYGDADLAPDWAALWPLAAPDRTVRLALRPLVFFLNQQGVRPGDVTEAHALAYLTALRASQISRDPETSYRRAVDGWNLAVTRLPGWPQRRLTKPSRRTRIALPLAQFPEGFGADLERYLGTLAAPDPFALEGRVQPLRPVTLAGYRSELVRFASVLVHAGIAIEAIDSLAAIVDPARVEAGLRWRLARCGGTWTTSLTDILEILRAVARRHVGLAPEAMAELDRFATRLRIRRKPGLTPKNAERLRPLDDPATLRRFLLLPDRLFARAAACPAAHRAALMRETAVAIAILHHAPVRRTNLAGIHLERNLQRPGDGRTFLVFEPAEVKTAQRIEFELPRPVVALIDRHLATRAPMLCPPGTPWLFPKRDGTRPMVPDHLAQNLKTTIRREIGIEFNAHLFRHFAARLYLHAHPGCYEAVRRLLGHSSLSRTLDLYAGFEAEAAARTFADVVARAKR